MALARLSSWFFSPIKLIVPSPTEVGGNADNVVHVIGALQATISRLMSRTIDNENHVTANAISIYFCRTSASSILIFEVNMSEPGFSVTTSCHSYIYQAFSRSTVSYETFGREGVKENESAVSSDLRGVAIGKFGCQICSIGCFVRWQSNR